MDRTAKVKWFDDSKGYGFAVLEDGREVFCHWSQVKAEGHKTLKPGQEITFSLYETPKGLEAKEIYAS
jgi:CspA family cold shock protein